MDAQSSFQKGQRYAAYVRHTNEKTALYTYTTSEYLAHRLPIKPNDKTPKRVLDLGCGTGANLDWLTELFKKHDVQGIDRSLEQLAFVTTESVDHVAFEDFSTRPYDFILVSHVLQYIDTDLSSFIKKVHGSLRPNGQAWFVQQTRTGMFEIISTVKEHLPDLRFRNWNTFEDYVRILHELHLSYETAILPTSFDGITFCNPTPEDMLRLEFMLCLQNGYLDASSELKASLSHIAYRPRIAHPNGIIKIWR